MLRFTKKTCCADIDFNHLVEELRYFSSIRGNCKLHIKCVDVALDLDANEDKKFFELFHDIADFVQIETANDIDEDGVIIDDRNRWNSNLQVRNANVCYFPFYYMSVSENGDIGSCCNSRFILSHIDTHSLKEVWDGQIRQLCRNMLEGKIAQHPMCARCGHWKSMMRPENYLDHARDEILERWNHL